MSLHFIRNTLTMTNLYMEEKSYTGDMPALGHFCRSVCNDILYVLSHDALHQPESLWHHRLLTELAYMCEGGHRGPKCGFGWDE